jgi:hypothetical protein
MAKFTELEKVNAVKRYLNGIEGQFDGKRPANEVLDELGEEVLPYFPAL